MPGLRIAPAQVSSAEERLPRWLKLQIPEVWVRFLLAIAGLALALGAAMFSTVSRESGSRTAPAGTCLRRYCVFRRYSLAKPPALGACLLNQCLGHQQGEGYTTLAMDACEVFVPARPSSREAVVANSRSPATACAEGSGSASNLPRLSLFPIRATKG